LAIGDWRLPIELPSDAWRSTDWRLSIGLAVVDWRLLIRYGLFLITEALGEGD